MHAMNILIHSIHVILCIYIQTKIPNLGSLEDISEFIDGAVGINSVMSDSEADDYASKVMMLLIS